MRKKIKKLTMPKSNIPSPAHSVGAPVTPRRLRHRSSRSMGSPARSTASGRLSTIIDEFKENNKDSFAASPLCKTVLSDNTDIEEPRRKSWWKKIENSRDVIDVLENEKQSEPIDMIEELDVEILSQEKKDYTLDLPESSGSESISSIVIPQRKLFTQKENLLQNKFGHLIGSRESLTTHNKTNIGDKTMANVGTKKLFNRGPKRPKPVFPPELLTLSPDKTVANKTKELTAEVKVQAKNLFGNRPGAMRKNMFVDCNFIASESEDEIPDIQPRVFAFQKNPEPMRKSSALRGFRESSPTSSITTDIEMDDWNLLPSSTMVEHQLEDIGTTPGKRAGLSKLSEVKESDLGTNTSSTVNKTKQSYKFVSPKSKSRTSESVATKEQKLEKSVSSRNKTESSENADELDNSPKKDLTINKSRNKSKINRSSNKVNNSQQKVTENKEYDKEDDNHLKNKSQILDTIANNQLSKSKNHEQEVPTLNQVETEIQPHQIALNEEDQFENDEDIALTYEEDELTEGTPHDNAHSNKDKDEDNDEDMETPLKEKSHLKGNKVVEETPDSGKLIVLKQPEKVKVNKSSSVEHASIVKENSNEVEPSKYIAENKTREASIYENENEHDENEQDDEQDDDPEEIENEEELQSSENQDAIASDDENETDQQEQSEILENDEDDIHQESSNVRDEDDSGQEEVEYEEEDEQDVSQQEVDDQNASQQEIDEQHVSEQEVDEQDEEEMENQDASQEEIDEQEVSEKEMDEQGASQEEVVEQEVSEEEMDEQGASQEVDEQEASDEVEVDEHDGDQEIENDSQDIENTEKDEEEQGYNSDAEKIEEPKHSETDTPNTTHDTTGRNRKKNILSPEAILHVKTNEINSFIAKGRNTSMRRTLLRNSTIRPSLMPARESTGISDGTRNSSAEGSGWDSHRTTRKTLRQTFGKDFSPRKSLRTLVIEKSAKRQTTVADANAQLYNEDTTELPAAPQDIEMDYEDNVEDNIEESVHEISSRTRQTNLEMYMEKLKNDNIERKRKIEEQVRNSLKLNPVRIDDLNFRIPANPAIRRRKPISLQTAPKVKRVKKSVVALEDLPQELIDDMNYKPPKRYQPRNASWITKRLYKFLESKLEPKYDYRARVRAEKLVETIYEFAKELRRQRIASTHAVTELKREMARLNVVKTHFEFYNFFDDYMPLEIKMKVVPDIINNISLPREGVFSDILL